MSNLASFSTSLRNSRGQAIINAINSGAGSGSALFYDGTKPANGGVITNQVLLGTVTFAEPAASVANGTVTFNTITDDSIADATGVAQFVRVLDGDGAFVMDLAVTDLNAAGPVKMASTSVYQGGVLHVASFVIVEGNT